MSMGISMMEMADMSFTHLYMNNTAMRKTMTVK